MLWSILKNLAVAATLLSYCAQASSSRRRRSKSKKIKIYDTVLVGGGFSNLNTAMRLGQDRDGELSMAILEAENTGKKWGVNKNGLPLEASCLGGRVYDVPYKCNKNRDGCPKRGYVWFGDHAMRYKTTHGSFFLAQELGFQSIKPEGDMYDEAEGSIGNDRYEACQLSVF